MKKIIMLIVIGLLFTFTIFAKNCPEDLFSSEIEKQKLTCLYERYKFTSNYTHGNYINGIKEGSWYYPRRYYFYVNGKKEGEQKEYAPGGDLKSIFLFEDGKLKVWKRYKNNKLISVLSYKDGKLEKEQKFSKRGGDIKKVTLYQNGKIISNEKFKRTTKWGEPRRDKGRFYNIQVSHLSGANFVSTRTNGATAISGDSTALYYCRVSDKFGDFCNDNSTASTIRKEKSQGNIYSFGLFNELYDGNRVALEVGYNIHFSPDFDEGRHTNDYMVFGSADIGNENIGNFSFLLGAATLGFSYKYGFNLTENLKINLGYIIYKGSEEIEEDPESVTISYAVLCVEVPPGGYVDVAVNGTRYRNSGCASRIQRGESSFFNSIIGSVSSSHEIKTSSLPSSGGYVYEYGQNVKIEKGGAVERTVSLSSFFINFAYKF